MILGAQLYTVRDYTQTPDDFVRTMERIAKIGYKYVQVSSIGSPVGKIKVDEDMDAHMEVLANCVKAAKIFDTKDAVYGDSICPAGKVDGGIPEILAALDKKVDGEMILTLEPHLAVFEGFAALEAGEKTKMPNTYASNAEAFAAATDALNAIIANIAK